MTTQEFLNVPRGGMVKFDEKDFKGCCLLMDHPHPHDAWRLIRYMKFSYMYYLHRSEKNRIPWIGFVDVATVHAIEVIHHAEQFRKARRVA